jgi:enamine deaminase RidA (YjgF/YER057c/UK114 family)
MNTTPEKRIAELKILLPQPLKPVGIYKPLLVVDKLIYLSGHAPVNADGSLIQGRLGEDMSLEEGILAARQVGLTMLSTIRKNLGDLNQVKRLIKVFGIVNSTADFNQHPAVINGFSALMAEIYGAENGVGVRSAIGAFLPLNIAVEIEAVFEIY